MTHLPNLVTDLALILITAGIVTIVFKWLKQPVVLGYIVAGFLVGPHMSLLPSIVDNASIETWSEIGIIFLLFALGLEFRFHKLLKSGSSALTAAIINMSAMIGIGYLAGWLLGWTYMESLYLGGMLSMASTTIIIKAFNDMGKQNQRFASIVFAILIIEDIAAILMMVLFSTIAVSKTFEGEQLIESLFKLIFFMVIWFTVGIFLIPTVIKKVRKFLNDETLLVVSVGLCLGMVMLAASVGFSAALGAFIMGTILAESVEGKRIEHLVEPLKNLFGAIFFVSVGMMIVPELIVSQLNTILILTGVVIVGRIIFATLGTVAAGESLKVSMQAGFSLAQIGEFSFIIATLGIQLGVISEMIYPVIVAVSVITTFTTPYGIRYADWFYEKVAKVVPPTWNKLLNGYAANRPKRKPTANSFDFSIFLKKFAMPIAVYFILSVAVNILCKMFVIPFIVEYIPNVWGRVISAMVTLFFMAPFLYGMMHRGTLYLRLQQSLLWQRDENRSLPAHVTAQPCQRHRRPDFRQQMAILREERRKHRTQFVQEGHKITRWGIILVCQIPRAIGVALIVSVLAPLFPLATGLLVVIAIGILAFITFSPRYAYQSSKIESVFLDNLNSGTDA
ncbi:sodium:proton antiporter [Bacteroidia bacterium]|nr:sodium:proton antiporter [Bacteroidia bacterium]